MSGPQHSIGKDRAISMYKSGWWKNKTSREICDVQLFTAELCMDFADFHKAITECLARPVFTHEFGLNYDGLVAEYCGEKEPPTLEQIINMLPKEKTIIAEVL